MADASISIETMRILENHRIDAQEEYEDHFDTLSNLLVLQSNGLLHEALATAMGRNLDPELAIKAADVSRARDEFTQAAELGLRHQPPHVFGCPKGFGGGH